MLITESPCRACKGPLESVLDFGSMALSGFPLDMSDDLPKAPLELCRCAVCGFVQLRHTVEPDALFRQYWYQSGVNETMRAELGDVVSDAIEHLGGLWYGDVVVDAGANDGTLLSFYRRDVSRVAFEPAENLQPALSLHCDEQYTEFFPGEHLPALHSVSLFTSIACFYAVDDPLRFVEAIDNCLTYSGLWVVQFQDLHQMLAANALDDICHEHLFYPSLASVERLIAPFDLAIVDAEHRKINGGSLRLTLGRRWRGVSPRVVALRAEEVGCEDISTLQAFAERAYQMRDRIRAAVADGVVDLYGASTKGNTLLQFCGLGPNEIRQAWERSPEKWGRHTITGIPIVSEEAGRANPPDALFVGIWQFKDAIIKREAAYLHAGGRLIFPLPEVDTYVF